MIWHPFTLCLWLLDLSSWLIYLAAATRILAALPGWRPGFSDRPQLVREFRLEIAAIQGRWLLALQLVHLVLLITAVTVVWPAYVPGAMCGMGVMQAMAPFGYQAVGFRLAAGIVLLIWGVVNRIDAQDPLGRSTDTAARLLLTVGPFLFASGLTLSRGLAAVRPDHPVSCCSIIYDQAAVLADPGASNSGLSPGGWMGICLLAWPVLGFWGYRQWRRPMSASPIVCLSMAGIFLLWAAAAVTALKYGFSAYIYQVLSHPCLWCLFLPEHNLIGFVLFGLLGAATYAIVALAAGCVLCARQAHACTNARRTARQAGLLLLAGGTAFLLAAGGPALIWRLRFGAWF